jgi:molybdenum cofactor cytidylyltransferase
VNRFVTGLVLGAGASRRLGQPKQLLPYQGRPLLQTAVNNALAAAFSQVVVTIGGAAPEVKALTEFGSASVVENVHYTTGCSSSIVAALEMVDPRASGIVLLLGDQPGVSTATINSVITQARGPLAVSRYIDGRGHPLWFGQEIFDELRSLKGDKAVWKLLESGSYPVAEIACAGPIPGDVDTWDDYDRLLASEHAS